MPNISQEVRNLFSGVSKQPMSQRAASFWSQQDNALVYQGRLLGRRPPTFHVANIDSSTTGEATTIPIVRSAVEKYTAVILNGAIKVYNAFTGTELSVVSPDGLNYLTSSPDGFRWVTIGDRTVIVNRTTVTAKGTETSPSGVSATSLVVVLQGNFGTNYGILLNGTDVQHLTPGSTTGSAEAAIGTDVIAEELYDLLVAEGAFTGVFTFSLHGSAIAITPVTPATPYTLQTFDGLGNEGMTILKGSVQRFEDLPSQAPEGTLMEVRGDDSTAFDNYWVIYDSDKGVWKETVAPDCILGYDRATMPHVLEFKGAFIEGATHEGTTSNADFADSRLDLAVNGLVGHLCRNTTDGSQGTVLSNTSTTIHTTPLAGGGRNTFKAGDIVEVVGYGTYFMFKQAPWADRKVGDTITNPDRSFIGQEIRDVFVVQGRLGLVSDEAVIQSRTSKLFDLYRGSVTQVLPDDPIDITETLPSSSRFHSALEWGRKAYVFTDLAQYELSGEPIMTPETVSLRQVAQYPNSSRCRPVPSGDRIFFVGFTNGLAKLMEFFRSGQEQELKAQSISDEIPAFIVGTPILLEADDTAGLLLVLTRDGTDNNLYAYSYVQENGQRVQSAWGEWFLNGDPLA